MRIVDCCDSLEVAFEPETEPPLHSSSVLQQLVDGLSAVVFPAQCSLCHRELTGVAGGGVCQECWASLGRAGWTGVACSHCGLPFASDRPLESDAPLCGECRKGNPAFDLARSYGLYAGRLREAILQMKFHDREHLGKRLGGLMSSSWRAFDEALQGAAPLLIPVPLHRARQRERGFNQALLLAQGLRRELSVAVSGRPLRVETRCLRRARPTAPQLGLNLRARRENVRGVFVVDRPERVSRRDCVLVDDVMTTGATLSACAAALKRAGARQVLAVTLARATPQFPDFIAGDGAVGAPEMEAT